MVTGTLVLQPLASVTVKVCKPALNPACAGAMVYGTVPPAGMITTEPVDDPLHRTLVWVKVAVRAAGWGIVIGTLMLQPLASVTVEVCKPALNPVWAGLMKKDLCHLQGWSPLMPVDASDAQHIGLGKGSCQGCGLGNSDRYADAAAIGIGYGKGMQPCKQHRSVQEL